MADVRYLVTVDAQGAIKSMKDFEGALDGVGETASPKVEKKFLGLWTQVAMGEFVYDKVKQAGRAVVDLFKDSIAEAAGYEKAVTGLYSAYEISGRVMPGTTGNLIKYADELQGVGLADDAAILKAQSLLLQLTNLDENGIKVATRGAIGMASVFNMDLQSAAEAVAKGMEGNYIMLDRLIPAVRNATTEEEKRAAMLKTFEGLYARAIADTDTYAGQVKKLGLEWGEAKKIAGEYILELGILQRLMTGASFILKEWTGATKGTKDAQRDNITAVYDFAASLNFVKPSITYMLEIAAESSAAFKEYAAGIKAMDDYLKKNEGSIVAWMKAGLESLGFFDKSTAALKGNLDIYGPITSALMNLKEQASATFSSEIEEKILKIQTALRIFGGQLSQDSIKKMRDMIEDLKFQLNTLTFEKAAEEAANATAATIKFGNAIEEPLERSLLGVFGPVRDFAALVRDAMIASLAALGFQIDTTDTEIGIMANTLNVSANSVRLMTYEMIRLSLVAAGIQLPDFRIPEPPESGVADWVTTLKKVSKVAQEVQQVFSQLFSAINQLSSANLAAQTQNIDEYYKRQKAALDQQYAYVAQFTEAINALDKNYQKDSTARERAKILALEAIDNDRSLSDEERAAKKKAIEDQYRDQSWALEDEYNRKKEEALAKQAAGEKAKAAAELKLQQDTDLAKKNLARQAAVSQKNIAIAEAIINTSVAITKALSGFIPPFNIIMAAVSAAAGYLQVRAIQSQPLPLARGAAFNQPTEFMTAGGGRYVAGDDGMEIMVGEKEIRRVLREERDQAGRGRQQASARFTIPLVVDGQVFAQKVLDVVMAYDRSGNLKLKLYNR